MNNDLMRLQRIRDIPDTAVRQEDQYTFYLKSQSDKFGEIEYMVFFMRSINAKTREETRRPICTCNDYLFRNTEETTDYECKHIGKVRDLLLRRLNK
jgi:hypothetical protein